MSYGKEAYNQGVSEEFTLTQGDDDAPTENGSEIWLSHDSLRDYFRASNVYPAIDSAEQEVILSKRIEAGLLANEALGRSDIFEATFTRQLPRLCELPEFTLPDESDDSAERQVRMRQHLYGELALLACDAVVAKHEFAEGNIKLVSMFAKEQRGRGLNMADLISVGNVGLMKAIERFDYTKGIKFSSYAKSWIEDDGMRNAVLKGDRLIAIPWEKARPARDLRIKTYTARQKLGREPSDAELADMTGLPVDKISAYKGYSQRILSLNYKKDEDGTDQYDSEFGETLADPNASSLEERVLDQITRSDLVKAILSKLTPQQLTIVQMKFGFSGEEPMTARSIGMNLRMSTTAVGTVLYKICVKMRDRYQL